MNLFCRCCFNQPLKKSFSLVEIIVSSLLVTLMASAAGAVMIFTARRMEREALRVVALEYSNYLLDEFIFDTPFDDPVLAVGGVLNLDPNNFDPDHPFWSIDGAAVSYTARWYDISTNQVVGAPTNAKKIRLNVSWNTARESFTETISTIKLE